MSKVTVVDYGLGNIHSVVKALTHEGADVLLTSSAGEIDAAERLVLPGVGAFGDGMAELHRRGLSDAVRAYALSHRPLLGICLGMQVLFEESEEFGKHEGLGLIPGRVVEVKKAPGLKVPHIGWNTLEPPEGTSWEGSVLRDVTPGDMAYFVHSFEVVPSSASAVLAHTRYGGTVVAAIRAGQMSAVQFHPEKSGRVGLSMLRAFLRG
jgi:glutamine amidotransferase